MCPDSNRTHKLLVCGRMLQPTEPPNQGQLSVLKCSPAIVQRQVPKDSGRPGGQWDRCPRRHVAGLKQGLRLGQEVTMLWILDAQQGPCWEGRAEGDTRSLPAQLRMGSEAALAQHTARSCACAPHSCPQLPHSAVDTARRPQRAPCRPGGSVG